jgi:hypothetical protein
MKFLFFLQFNKKKIHLSDLSWQFFSKVTQVLLKKREEILLIYINGYEFVILSEELFLNIIDRLLHLRIRYCFFNFLKSWKNKKIYSFSL